MKTEQINPAASTAGCDVGSGKTESPCRIRLADYQLVSRLGSGGYGEVWKAIGPGGLPKAVKLLHGERHGVHAEAELKALERMRDLRHPFLLNIERIEVVDSQVVVVTELADCSLADRFDEYRKSKRHGIPREELLGYLKDAADALDFMAELHGLQHLDIKPDNLLLQGGHAKVGDFGLAKDLNVTNVSLVNGFTPLFAAPELFEGRPGRGSDQYSLAVVYQLMLTGQPPFSGRTAAQLTAQHLRSQPELIHLQPIDRPVVARALSKNQNSRYESCRQFVEELQRRRTSRLHAGGVAPQLQHGDEELHPTSVVNPSEIVTVRQKPSSPVATEAVDTSDARLRPVVVIGVGGLAGHVLCQFKHQLVGSDSACEAVQLLQIDTDREALQDLRQHEDGEGLSGDDTVAIPLRTATQYRSSSQLDLSWMSRRWLFNIPRSGQVQGIRPLGRLALYDHREIVRGQIEQRLLRVACDDVIQDAANHCELPFSADGIDVYVVASTAGGTSSGAVADVGLLVRSIVNAKALRNVEIHGVLLHGTGAVRTTTDLQEANTLATLKELRHLSTPGLRVTKGFERGTDNSDAVPFDHAYFVHLGNSLNDGLFMKKAAELARHLLVATTTSAAVDFRAWRTATPEHQGEAGRMRLLGFSSHHAEAYHTASRESSSLCTVLLRRWCGAVGRHAPAECKDIPVELSDTETLLTELDLTESTLPEFVMTLLRGQCGQEIDAVAAEINARLAIVCAPDVVTHGQALDFMTEQLSRKADTPDNRRTLQGIVSGLRSTLDTTSKNAQLTIVRHLQAILDSPHRLEGARAAGQFTLGELRRTQAGCRSLVREIEQAFAALATEAPAEATFAADHDGSAADALRAFTKQYCVLLAYQAVYHCIVQHVDTVTACIEDFLENQDELQLELESVASAISTTMVLSSTVPQPIIDAFDRHLRSSEQSLVSGLASKEVTRETFSTRIVSAATHFLMSASEKYDGPQHEADRRRCRFPEGAWPLLSGSGGQHRVLGLIPEWIDHAGWKTKLEESFGDCVAVRPVTDEAISVVCEISDVPVDNVMDELTGHNPHIADIASRIHTRIDVDW